MQYKRIDNKDLDFFRNTIGESNVFTDEESLKIYGQDYTEDFVFPPEVVLKPNTVEEISKIVKYCNQLRIPIYPRGAGTSLSGGSLPVHGGVSLAMENFNKILDIDIENFQATVEPGVINDIFRIEVEKHGLFYPPDPASKGSCFLGGNIAHNSGGPKALKYGITRDYVLNLEVVLANGDVIWTGANVLKNSTGYSLTQLMVGSEGTLGIVTKIVFKLIPSPAHNLLMLAYFRSIEDACASVNKVFLKGVQPSAMELMERNGVELVTKHTESSFPFGLDESCYLLIEVDGNNLETLMQDCEMISEELEKTGVVDILFADTVDQKERLWKVRRSIGEIVKLHSVYKEEDTVVPRAALPELMTYIKNIGKETGFQSVCYGHAGDGNLHVNILKEGMTDEQWKNDLPHSIRKIFIKCRDLGGTISGEHGIGMVQKEYMNIVFTESHFRLTKEIKRAFDPHLILNPGKIIDLN
jgi:glycolate oxidase